MSRNRRDDPNQRSERTAEQRERERLEREARRAGSRGAGEPSTASPAEQTPLPTASDDRRPPPLTDDPRPSRDGRVAGRRGGRSGSATPQEPIQPPSRDRAADRRAARRSATASARDQPPPLVRIQPDPPAPPAAAAGVLGDETDLPIGIRRVRRAVTPRASRTIVTPPGDVPAGPARARRSLRRRLAALAVVLGLFVLVVAVLLTFQPFGSAQGDEVRVTIPSGSSAREIGNLLASKDIVSSGLLFSVRAALAGKRGDLLSGPHTMNRSMTYGAAIEQLTRKPPVANAATFDVTIPEGRSRREIAGLVASKRLIGSYLEASKRFSGRLNPFRYGAPKGTRSLEGFLFPSTYELKRGAPVSDLVAKQLAAFKDNFASVDLRRAKRKNLTGYDVLKIASMVEREAQLPGERAKIAAVIYNRLHDGTPLGIDATIRYSLNDWTQPLKESQLMADTPYNTRTRKGLPPTPIGNPGLASIRAAAHPANVNYRYYVVKPGTCGEHAFSSTFAQFDRDRQRYDQARAAAGGKSPTTC